MTNAVKINLINEWLLSLFFEKTFKNICVCVCVWMSKIMALESMSRPMQYFVCIYIA